MNDVSCLENPSMKLPCGDMEGEKKTKLKKKKMLLKHFEVDKRLMNNLIRDGKNPANDSSCLENPSN